MHLRRLTWLPDTDTDARHTQQRMLRKDLKLKSFKSSTVLSNHVSKRRGSCYPGCLVPACQTLWHKKERKIDTSVCFHQTGHTQRVCVCVRARVKLIRLTCGVCILQVSINPEAFPRRSLSLASNSSRHKWKYYHVSQIPKADHQS